VINKFLHVLSLLQMKV